MSRSGGPQHFLAELQQRRNCAKNAHGRPDNTAHRDQYPVALDTVDLPDIAAAGIFDICDRGRKELGHAKSIDELLPLMDSHYTPARFVGASVAQAVSVHGKCKQSSKFFVSTQYYGELFPPRVDSIFAVPLEGTHA